MCVFNFKAQLYNRTFKTTHTSPTVLFAFILVRFQFNDNNNL